MPTTFPTIQHRTGHHGLGWRRDFPDPRDHTPQSPGLAGNLYRRLTILRPRFSVTPTLTGTTSVITTGPALPAAVDNRDTETPVGDQLTLGSCTANAVMNALGALEKRAHGVDFMGSRLFTYYQTRHRLMHEVGDVGAYLRSTIGTVALYGAPPESEWPYDPSQYEVAPPADLYPLAGAYKGLSYLRCDAPGGQYEGNSRYETILNTMKGLVAIKVPLVTGFAVYRPALDQAMVDPKGCIPLPGGSDMAVGGHAVEICGYDDNLEILNRNPVPAGSAPNQPTTGAWLFKNSWSQRFGEGGYGRIPYAYLGSWIQAAYMSDVWGLLSASYIDASIFQP